MSVPFEEISSEVWEAIDWLAGFPDAKEPCMAAVRAAVGAGMVYPAAIKVYLATNSEATGRKSVDSKGNLIAQPEIAQSKARLRNGQLLLTHHGLNMYSLRADRAGTGGLSNRPQSNSEVDKQGSQCPINGMSCTEDDVPPAFRDRNGEILDSKYLEESHWCLKTSYLSKNFGQEKTLTTRIKVGPRFVYRFDQLSVLIQIKTANEENRRRKR